MSVAPAKTRRQYVHVSSLNPMYAMSTCVPYYWTENQVEIEVSRAIRAGCTKIIVEIEDE